MTKQPVVIVEIHAGKQRTALRYKLPPKEARKLLRSFLMGLAPFFDYKTAASKRKRRK